MQNLKAPLWNRISAFLIDMLISAALSFLPSYFGYVVVTSAKGTFGIVLGYSFMLLGAVSGIGLVLFRDGMYSGMGMGKRMMRVRVVKRDGSRCDYSTSALRNITLVFPLLNALELVLAVVDLRGMRLGDRIAGTQVVE